MGKKIFICYAHEEAHWKDRLVTQLAVLTRQGVCEVWVDDNIRTGDDWNPEIEKALNDTSIAILLISADFFKSDFIQDKEIPKILELRESKGLRVIPILARPCPWEKVDWLANIQGEPRDGTTLEEIDEKGKAEKALAEIIKRIDGYIKETTFWDNSGTPAHTTISSSSTVATVVPAAPVMQPLPTAGILPDNAANHNPFIEVHAIRDSARFVGRQKAIKLVIQLLHGASVSLQGDHKIGKSSLLWHLKRVYTGKVIGPFSFHFLSWDEIMEKITVEAETGKQYRCKKDFRDILHSFAGLLLLDEMESAPGNGLTLDDCGQMRGCLEENRNCHIVTASRIPLSNIPGLSDPLKSSPLHNVFQPQRLGHFEEAEARLLLAHPWSPGVQLFDGKVVDELLGLAVYQDQGKGKYPGKNSHNTKPGYHPFLLQRAAFHRFEALSDPGYDWHEAFQREREQML